MSSIHTFPADLPPALQQGHSFQPLANARNRKRDQGETRMRPRYRSVPDQCVISWFFETQEEFDTFHDWFEDTVVVGSSDFDLQVADRDTFGVTWWTARFIDEYKFEVDEVCRYTVSAQLLLVEELGPTRVAPGIEASGGIEFAGGVSFAPPLLRASGGIAFGGGVDFGLPALTPSGGIAFSGGWTIVSVEGFVTEDNDQFVTEGGDTLTPE